MTTSSLEARVADFAADLFTDCAADFFADFFPDFFALLVAPRAAPEAACVFAAGFPRAIAALVSPVGASAWAAALPLDAAGVVPGARVLPFCFFGSGIVLSVREQPARGCAIHLVHGSQDDVVRVNFSAGSHGVQRRRTNGDVRAARAGNVRACRADELAAVEWPIQVVQSFPS